MTTMTKKKNYSTLDAINEKGGNQSVDLHSRESKLITMKYLEHISRAYSN